MDSLALLLCPPLLVLGRWSAVYPWRFTSQRGKGLVVVRRVEVSGSVSLAVATAVAVPGRSSSSGWRRSTCVRIVLGTDGQINPWRRRSPSASSSETSATSASFVWQCESTTVFAVELTRTAGLRESTVPIVTSSSSYSAATPSTVVPSAVVSLATIVAAAAAASSSSSTSVRLVPEATTVISHRTTAAAATRSIRTIGSETSAASSSPSGTTPESAAAAASSSTTSPFTTFTGIFAPSVLDVNRSALEGRVVQCLDRILRHILALHVDKRAPVHNVTLGDDAVILEHGPNLLRLRPGRQRADENFVPLHFLAREIRLKTNQKQWPTREPRTETADASGKLAPSGGV